MKELASEDVVEGSRTSRDRDEVGAASVAASGVMRAPGQLPYGLGFPQAQQQGDSQLGGSREAHRDHLADCATDARTSGQLARCSFQSCRAWYAHPA